MTIQELSQLKVSNAKLTEITKIATKRAWAKFRQTPKSGSLAHQADRDVVLDAEQLAALNSLHEEAELAARYTTNKHVYAACIKFLDTKFNDELKLCDHINMELADAERCPEDARIRARIVRLGHKHESLISQIKDLQETLFKAKKALDVPYPKEYLAMSKRVSDMRRQVQIDVVALVTKEVPVLVTS